MKYVLQPVVSIDVFLACHGIPVERLERWKRPASGHCLVVRITYTGRSALLALPDRPAFIEVMSSIGVAPRAFYIVSHENLNHLSPQAVVISSRNSIQVVR